MPKYTRKQYLSKECTHAEYYSQFVTASIIASVGRQIGVDRIKASSDQHLNDIPLKEWDRLYLPASDLAAKMKEAGDYLTLSGHVCIAKEAARQISASEG